MAISRLFCAFLSASTIAGCGGGGSSPVASPTPDAPPVAQASASQATPDLITTYNFSSVGSGDPEGAPLAYEWSFGDGSSSTEASPQHLFSKSGTYLVGLKVTDSGGATADTTVNVAITGPAEATTVSDQAATLTLPNVATVTVPSGSFNQSTALGVWTTTRTDTAADFTVSSDLFSSPKRAAAEIRINSGRVQPTKALQVAAVLPSELGARLAAGDTVQAFVQIFQAAGEETLDNFDVVASTFDAPTKTL